MLAVVVWVAAALLSGGPRAQIRAPLGPGPNWSGGQPAGSNAMFATADGCARCHSAAERSIAMRSALGEDISPHGLWQSTVMANSFRDPYWRAQVARECAEAPERAAEVQALCMRCHAPMQHHTRLANGGEAHDALLGEAVGDPLAEDGVSCTVCHQIRARHLGEPTTWGGKGRIGRGRVVYGPYEEPEADAMRGMSGFAAQHGAHLQQSALCATCHTLLTDHQGVEFPEQTPFLEWRNSVYADTGDEEARTCQQCHMADLGATRIARQPDGTDFLLQAREPYRAHAFVGGNAFLLELLADNRERLSVKASEAALLRTARATRRQLTTATVDLEILPIQHVDGELRFSVRVRNRTGHKFPTGYPARRAWLHVRVQNEGAVVFESGAFTPDGEIDGVIAPLDLRHVRTIGSRSDVLVWQLVAHDPSGEPTTSLTAMATRAEDNRLLPKGYRPDGPHVEQTAPVGAVLGDPDFVAGEDVVQVVIPYAKGSPRATVLAWVHYQAIPPHWVEDLRWVDDARCREFVAMYDAADLTPETIAAAVRGEPF